MGELDSYKTEKKWELIAYLVTSLEWKLGLSYSRSVSQKYLCSRDLEKSTEISEK